MAQSTIVFFKLSPLFGSPGWYFKIQAVDNRSKHAGGPYLNQIHAVRAAKEQMPMKVPAQKLYQARPASGSRPL